MNHHFSRKKHNRPERRFYQGSVLRAVPVTNFSRFLVGAEPMCPECFAAVALLITGIVSTGGLAAVAARLFHNKEPHESVSEVRIPKAKESSK